MSQAFNLTTRKNNLRALSLDRGKARFDLVIIGGGITGAAVARDASLRGLKVLLLEKNDFAWGTSSRSSKLIHGGVRYLEHFEFGLVFESVSERARLWKLAPHLVKPLSFLFPAYKTSRLRFPMLVAGLWLYDLLALFRVPTLHKAFAQKRTTQEEPALRSENLEGSVKYWDASTNDSWITLSNIKDAQDAGALSISRMNVESVEWNSQVANRNDAFHKVKAYDVLENQNFEFEARVVVYAAGPWTDLLWDSSHPKLATTRGSHIVVNAEKLPIKNAVVLIHPTDERVLFAIPWEKHTIVGTTDIFDAAHPDQTQMSPQEVDYLLKAAEFYFPKNLLKKEDVLSTWTGLRPLLAPSKDAGTASDISREHHLEWQNPGRVLICGGKLTTHRRMAQDTIHCILQNTRHWEFPLGQENPLLDANSVTDHRPYPNFLAPTQKSSSQLPDLNDIKKILNEQMVLELEDFFVRRTDIFYKAPKNGLEYVESLKSIFLEVLGWNEARFAQSLEKYCEYLEKNIGKPLERRIIR